MKYTVITTAIFLVAAAVASPVAGPDPADLEVRVSGRLCSGDTKQVCCNSVSPLYCVVQVAGATCLGDTYCCNTSAGTGTLVNVKALNCLKILVA
ncbi:hydrophobin [Apiospora rasikravindrae]|uniref:Hydrophobin n=1 Tax=Apiospora rasikravindrae TaxID=990691 RepID=A0ABR1RR20_9PEZI